MEKGKGVLSEFAVASLVLGIISFVNLFGVEKSIVAIVFGILALKRIAGNSRLSGKNLAISGIILGSVAMILLTTLTIKYFPQVKQTIENTMK